MPPPTHHDRRPNPAALLLALRDGTASFTTRLGLSIASAATGIGGLMLLLGMVEFSAGRVRDELVALGVLFVVILWLALLYPLWATYSRKRHVVRTIIACVSAVALTIGISTAFGISMRNPELFIAGTIFLGAAAIATLLSSAVHHAARGRALLTASGTVSVHCPRCGYSMSGLDSASCPECGARFTLDELIRAQEYDALKPAPFRRVSSAAPALLATPATTPPQRVSASSAS
jgi:hypothetical protein